MPSITAVDDLDKTSAMKAQLEEIQDAARKAELLREKLLPEDALQRGEDCLPDTGTVNERRRN